MSAGSVPGRGARRWLGACRRRRPRRAAHPVGRAPGSQGFHPARTSRRRTLVCRASLVPTTIWTYPHRDIGEPPLPDGTPIRRPSLTLQIPSVSEDLLAVVDSGSPISVADAQLFKWLGVDITDATPVYETLSASAQASAKCPSSTSTSHFDHPTAPTANRSRGTSSSAHEPTGGCLSPYSSDNRVGSTNSRRPSTQTP